MSKRKNKHGILWWLFIGWWWVPIKWVYFKLPVFFARKIFKTETAPKSTPKTEEPIVAKEPIVYITVKGRRFHYDRACSYLLNSEEVAMELSKARKAGYTACDKCCFDYLHE